jgi:hypothetical protein
VALRLDAWRARPSTHRAATRTCARVARALRLFCAAVISRRIFSRRTDWELTPNALSLALADRRAVGWDVVDLTISNPTSVGLSHPSSFHQSFYSDLVAAEPVASARERLAIIADTSLSVATPVQQALPGILRAAEEIRAPIRERTISNLVALRARLAGGAAIVLDAEAGWSAIVRLPELAGLDDERWALALLDRAGTLVHRGALYDLAGCHVVLSLLGPVADSARGVSALAREVASRVAAA